jgi:hypothetical protein
VRSDRLRLSVWRNPFIRDPKPGRWIATDQYVDRHIYFTIDSDHRAIAAGAFDEWTLRYPGDDEDIPPASLEMFVEAADQITLATLVRWICDVH